VIGPAGEFLYDYDVRLGTASPRAVRRFHDLICLDHSCFDVFGLVRADDLRRTPLLAPFAGADRNLLAELALLGPFHEVPETLFFRRDHPNTSTRQFPLASQRHAWFREASRGPMHPTFRRGYVYFRSLFRTPLRARERVACLAVLGKWTCQRLASMARLHALAPSAGKSYNLAEASREKSIDPMRRVRGDLQRIHEGMPVLRGRPDPGGP
jgi:hypothetical protein